MFLRCKVRRKDGKQHRYWSVVENTRVAGGRVVQRHVLYLGEINDTQEFLKVPTLPLPRRARVEAGNQRPWPADKVERWAIERRIPYAKNARTHTDAQVAAIAACTTKLQRAYA